MSTMKYSLLSALLLLLIPRLTLASTTWTIMVMTSDIKDAGSSAHVFASISGTRGYHAPLFLGNRHPRGGVQYLTVNMTVGIPYRMKVWHDNTGKEPKWHLERIVLISHKTWKQFMFMGRGWLSQERSLSRSLSVKGHLYIPGRREKSFPVITENHKLDITVDDIMGRANVSVSTDNVTGLVESVLVTIETVHVFNGKDKFIITVIPQKRLPETCEHTPSCLCYNRISQNMTGVDELKQLVEKLKEELTVDKKKTSVNLRRYISAMDYRPSSQAIGSVGAVFLVIPVVLIVLGDLLNVFKAKKKRPRVRYSLAKTNNSPRYIPPPEYRESDEKDDCLTEKELHYPEPCTSSADQIDYMDTSPAKTDTQNISSSEYHLRHIETACTAAPDETLDNA